MDSTIFLFLFSGPECQRDKSLNSHKLLSLPWLHIAWQMAECGLMFFSNLSVGWNQSQVIIFTFFFLLIDLLPTECAVYHLRQMYRLVFKVKKTSKEGKINK